VDVNPVHSSRFALPALLIGATAIGLAPIFVRLSELGPEATAFYRLFLSLPLLGLWVWHERNRRVAGASIVDRRARRWRAAAPISPRTGWAIARRSGRRRPRRPS